MEYGYGKWWMVGFSIIFTLYFVKSIFNPRSKRDWSTYRSFGAFIIALYAEMYGFPLTIYLLMSVLGLETNLGFSHDSGHLIGRLMNFQGDPHFSPFHIASYILIILGFFLISSSWNILYKSRKSNTLAVTGFYRYIRHPQYVGFSIIIVGFLLQWPTLITIVMAPFLLWRYYSLAKVEEREMENRFGSKYMKYKNDTPPFFPSLTKYFSKLSFMKSS